jgi:tRNA(Leu) C34 or U34 (ribose-2'-O)-methylase TrmL
MALLRTKFTVKWWKASILLRYRIIAIFLIVNVFLSRFCIILPAMGSTPYKISAPLPEPVFEIRQCQNPACGLRFPCQVGERGSARCPICRTPTQAVGAPYTRSGIAPGHPGRLTLEVVLDNIRSAWNVGSMLRTADGAGARRVHLCGVSPSPENPKVWKTALGAEKSVPWTFHPDGAAAARELRLAGMHLWALEGGLRAEPLFSAQRPQAGPLALVVGNEVSGVDPAILEECERVVSLPMLGVKGSLNVAVAFGIAVYALAFGQAE